MNIARLLRRLLVAGLLLALAAAIAGKWVLERPLVVPKEPWDFEVKSGATLAAVARDLAGDGVIPHPLPLVALARWKGVDRAIKAATTSSTRASRCRSCCRSSRRATSRRLRSRSSKGRRLQTSYGRCATAAT